MKAYMAWELSGVSPVDGERYFVDFFDTEEEAERGQDYWSRYYSDFEIEYMAVQLPVD